MSIDLSPGLICLSTVPYHSILYCQLTCIEGVPPAEWVLPHYVPVCAIYDSHFHFETTDFKPVHC